MLVDLARNDIGRVCDFGRVQVRDLMIIERYSHVMHIVSSVEGKLSGGKTPYDLMRATFPAGTVSPNLIGKDSRHADHLRTCPVG